MSWENINLKEISTQEFDLVPTGVYTFEVLPGAKYNEQGALIGSLAISSDGEFKGRRMFYSFPDPESTSSKGKVQSWSGVALKRFEQATGVDANDGESKPDYMNRVAGNRIQYPVIVKEDETGTKRANLQLLNVKPAL